MGLIMDEPATKVPKKETAEHSDSSSDEDEQSEEETTSRWTRTTDAELLKYRWCSWPEVVGLEAEEAKRIIEEGAPDLYVEVLTERVLRTMAYVNRRVMLIVDRRNCVVQTPRVG